MQVRAWQVELWHAAFEVSGMAKMVTECKGQNVKRQYFKLNVHES